MLKRREKCEGKQVSLGFLAARFAKGNPFYSTVTLLAKLRGLSGS